MEISNGTMKGSDILGVACGEDKASERISRSTCLGRRKTSQKRKQNSQRREWREYTVRKVSGQEGIKKYCTTDEEFNELDKATTLANKEVSQ